MDGYDHNLMLGQNFHLGDSVVRDFYTLDAENFIVEQEIAICLHFRDGHWTGKLLLKIPLNGRCVLTCHVRSLGLYRHGEQSS